ncbi:MAG TPA: hypothetical protein VIZ90_06880 [Rhizobiaceae bacterium]
MSDWLGGFGGPDFATAVVWTFAALILLVIVLVIIRLIRSLTFGTFVAGGRNRKTRLAVMDATAVDSHRRLVLVRRDDIEHLLLIGGPTDVVVEREIRLGQARRNQSVFGTTEAAFEAPAAAPLPPLPTAPQPARQRAPEPAHPPLPGRNGSQPQPARQPERVPQPVRRPTQPAPRPPVARPPVREMPMREPPVSARPNNPSRSTSAPLPPASSFASASMSTGMAPPQPVRSNSLDDALLRELEVSFDPGPIQRQAKPAEMTLDDEMTKLLGELSNNQR